MKSRKKAKTSGRENQKQVKFTRNNKGLTYLQEKYSMEFFAHIRIVFQDGYSMEFLSPVQCEKTGRTWKDKALEICGSRAAVKRMVKFHAQGTDYNSIGFHDESQVKEF